MLIKNNSDITGRELSKVVNESLAPYERPDNQFQEASVFGEWPGIVVIGLTNARETVTVQPSISTLKRCRHENKI